MNVENIKRVRDHIAALPPERFSMNVWAGVMRNEGGGCRFVDEPVVSAEVLFHACDTAACIGGWTNAILGQEGDRITDEGAAAIHLGLPCDVADALFYPDLDVVADYASLSISDAVAVLDHLIATGEVDWSVAAAPASPVEAA